MPHVKITVVKRLSFDDIHRDSDLGCSCNMAPACEVFTEGQEFICDLATLPEGFCAVAFTDLYRYIHGLLCGANYHWMNEKGTALACCTDGYRPVVFRLERIE